MKKLFLIITFLSLLTTFHSFAQLEYEFREPSKDLLPIVETDYNGLKGRINPEYFIDSAYKVMQQGHIPGASFCVIHETEPMWIHHLGWANIENSISVSDSTIFQLASISKPFVATALMQLWELDSLGLYDDINDYLPFEVKNPNWPEEPITFYQLLVHTSSIRDNFGELWDLEVYGEDSPIPLDTFLINYLVPGGIYYDSLLNYYSFMPGAQWEYCNVAYALLGYLVECISEMSFEDYCQQHIFQPLGMNNTSWFQANLDTNNIAMQYYWSIGTNSYIPYGLTGCAYYPCGQLRCTALDLAKFIGTTINHGTYNDFIMLDSSTVELMTTMYMQIPYYNESQGLAWYFSFDHNIWVHTGSWFGVRNIVGFDKEKKWGLIELTNGDMNTAPVPINELRTLMVNFTRLYQPMSVDSIYLYDSDGDFILETGEEITLHLGMRNNTNLTSQAENVTLHLSSEDPSIASISDPDIFFGNIFYNEMVFNPTDSLKFTLSNNLTSSKAGFNISIHRDDGNEYVFDFDLNIGAVDILLVKDETDWRGKLIQTENWYLQVLDSLGYDVYLYDISMFGDPKIEFLYHFPAVIWYTGYDLDNLLSEFNQQVLSDYLDYGGKLFLNGQNISDELAGTDFLQNYLHTSHAEDTWTGLDIIEGVDGDPIGNELLFWINQGDGVNGHNSMSIVEPIDDGDMVFQYYGTEDGAATRFENGTYQTVFFAFGFETINEFENRLEIMSRILNEYFSLVPGEKEIQDTELIDKKIQIFPNPFNKTFSILYSLIEKCNVNIKIYDLQGQLVNEPINQIRELGNHKAIIKADGLPPGIYFCTLKTNEQTITKKMIKL